MYKICLLAGDGVGKEVIPAARRVLEASKLEFDFVTASAGWETFEQTGTSVPRETFDIIKASDATLAGAFTSPKHSVEGFFSAIRYLRRELELFANLRPAKSRPVKDSLEGIDMLMVRENTEGLYVAQERRYGDTAIADAVITKKASARITKVALDLAKQRSSRLAIIHKANVLPVTSGLFLSTAFEEAKLEPSVDSYDIIVDAAAMMLVRQPQSFDVMVTTNLFGDILSDLMAGLVGGLGIAPSANLGNDHALFEPVHGSAPDIAGKGVANPTAAILSAAMMLEYLGEKAEAARIDAAVNKALSSEVRTSELGGSASTEAFTDVVIQALE